MSQEPEGVFREPHRIRGAEADANGRLSVRSACELMQEAAARHASALGVGYDELVAQGLAWVLVQWTLTVTRWPLWRDEVLVETWPCARTERTAARDFLLLDATGTELCRAESVWLILDLQKRRPVRLPEEVRSIRPPREPLGSGTELARLLPPSPVDETLDLAVRWTDLDLNAHVSNVAYVDWVLESVPRELLRAGALRSLSLSFRSEARDGASVRVERGRDASAPDGRPGFRHRVVETASARELLLARTVFVPAA